MRKFDNMISLIFLLFEKRKSKKVHTEKGVDVIIVMIWTVVQACVIEKHEEFNTFYKNVLFE